MILKWLCIVKRNCSRICLKVFSCLKKKFVRIIRLLVNWKWLSVNWVNFVMIILILSYIWMLLIRNWCMLSFVLKKSSVSMIMRFMC